MWAMRLIRPFTFETLDVESLGPSKLTPGQVRLHVLAGGICGSDLAHYRGTQTTFSEIAERIPGFCLHEVVGDVIESAAPSIQVGERVVGWATAMNGLAEYVVTDATSVFPYDQRLTPTDAIMLQPLSCILYAVERLGRVDGYHCAVLGQGPIGVLFSHVLKSSGARRVTAVDRVLRADLTNDFGVDQAVIMSSGQWLVTMHADDAPEVIVEAIGHQISTLSHAVDAIRPDGRIFYFGVPDDPIYPIDMEKMLRKRLTLSSGATLERPRVLEAAQRYVISNPGLIRAYNTHVFGRDQVAEAFEAADQGRAGVLKVAIEIDQ